MADTVEREASKLRLLKMAADYDCQAQAADGLVEPNVGEAMKVKADRKIAKEPSEAV